MKKLFSLAIVLLLTATLLAQEPAPKPEGPPPPDPVATAAYRLDVTISEVENGKRGAPHSYVLNVAEGNEWARLRLGSRVPVPNGHSNDMQYTEAGVNIDARVRQASAGLRLDFTAEVNAPAGEVRAADLVFPVIRHFRFSTETLIPVGTAVLLNGSDDLNAPRRIEVQVTATHLK